jgi:hypothetical protein
MEKIILVFLVNTVFIVTATVTGNQEKLCDLMGGTYVEENAPTGENVCPGGKWTTLLLTMKDKVGQDNAE